MALLPAVTAGLFGALFAATFLLQDVLRLDPLTTGLYVLPMTALMVLGAPAAAAALRLFGPRRTAIAGTALVVLGVAGLSRLGRDSAWTTVGGAFAAVTVTATGTAVGDAPPGYAGAVGALKQPVMDIGPVLGIAVAAGTSPTSAASAPTTGSTLLVLAGTAALGLLPASLLPPGPTPRARRGTTAPAPAQARTKQPAAADRSTGR